MTSTAIDENAPFDLRLYSKTKNAADMAAALASILANLWPSSDVFTRMPDSVVAWGSYGAMTTLPGSGSYTQINSPHRIVYLCFDMPKGIKCRTVYFPAKDSAFNGRLLIFHQGHNNTFDGYQSQMLIDANAAGYDLLICYMPLLGPNTTNPSDPNWPGTTVRVGASFQTHEDLAPFASSTFNPLGYFIEPVIGSINHCLTLRTYTKIGMAGISGGGWTSVLAPALDQRITHSYCVAGSWPPHWWTVTGDYEQKLPGISNIMSSPNGGDYVRYTDLWLMCCQPSPRRHMLIYNRYDPSQFAGGNSMELRPQLQAMRGERGGGYIEVKVDNCDVHTISNNARAWIFADLNS